MEKARVDAVQKFKASQSYIDSCADYYGTEFDDCLKQVVSAFLELDLSGITMDDPKLNSTHVYLEKSSTMTIIYLFPPRCSVLVGPIRST